MEGLARSPMRSLYVHFLCIARDIESKNICTANTSLIHWISFNQKPGMQATNLFERQCVNQVRSEFQYKTRKCSELSGEAVLNSFILVSLGVENNPVVSSRSQHFSLLHRSRAEEVRVAGVLRSIRTAAVLVWK